MNNDPNALNNGNNPSLNSSPTTTQSNFFDNNAGNNQQSNNTFSFNQDTQNNNFAAPNNANPVNQQPTPSSNNTFFNNPNAAPANTSIPPLENTTNNAVNLEETSQPTVPNQQQVILGSINNLTYADTIGDISNTNSNASEGTSSNTGNNQFINTNNNYSETALDDLNVDDSYNKLHTVAQNPEDYINDPAVQANIHQEKSNTVTITKELKTIVALVGVLLVFIFIMPYIVDFVRNIIYH